MRRAQRRADTSRLGADVGDFSISNISGRGTTAASAEASPLGRQQHVVSIPLAVLV